MASNSARSLKPAKKVVVTPEGAYQFLARIYHDNGNRLLGPDDVRLVSVSVAPKDDQATVRALPLRPDNLLSAALRLDEDWTVDAEGYNFKHRLFPDLIRDRGRVYVVEYEFLLLGDDPAIPIYRRREAYEVQAGTAL